MRMFFSILLFALSLHSCAISLGALPPNSFPITFLNRQAMCSAAHLGSDNVEIYVSEQQAAKARLGKAPIAPNTSGTINPRRETSASIFADALPASIRFSIQIAAGALLALVVFSSHPLIAVVASLTFGFSACNARVFKHEYPALIQPPVDVSECKDSDILLGLIKGDKR